MRPARSPEDRTAYAINDALKNVEPIGLGRIEGPEDVILDRNDHLYCGSRHGDIVRFFAPTYEKMEVFAHIGGQPLGMAFDRDDNLYVCVGGMGLYRIAPDGSVTLATDETNRSMTSINDDSRLRLADDLDIAPDGRVFFSEATIRYEMHEWAVDSLEARGNGRIICYDPKTNTTQTVLRGLVFPNGISMASDGKSFLFAETWGCTLNRYWFDGPKKGTHQVLIPNLPGLPDNINRASDGNFWVALTGMRSPAFDLALRLPGFRRRMAKRLPPDEWMYPNINVGCVIKVTEEGKVLRGPLGSRRYQPSEHHFDAGASGLPLPRRFGQQPYRAVQAEECAGGLRSIRHLLERHTVLEKIRVIALLKEVSDRLLGRGEAAITVPPMDGPLKPNHIIDNAEVVAELDDGNDLASDGETLWIAEGRHLFAPAARQRERVRIRVSRDLNRSRVAACWKRGSCGRRKGCCGPRELQLAVWTSLGRREAPQSA